MPGHFEWSGIFHFAHTSKAVNKLIMRICIFLLYALSLLPSAFVQVVLIYIMLLVKRQNVVASFCRCQATRSGQTPLFCSHHKISKQTYNAGLYFPALRIKPFAFYIRAGGTKNATKAKISLHRKVSALML